MKLKDFSKLYFALLVLHIVTLYKPEFNNTLFYFSKPLIIFSLLSYFIHKTSALYIPAKFIFMGGLFFSLVGDVFLMFDSTQSLFLAGVGSFLLAQLAYTYFYIANARRFNWRSLAITIVPIAVAFYFLNFYLSIPKNLVLPINVYGITLAAMVLSAVNYGTALGRRALFINVGALVFLLSDLILAYAKFGAGQNKYVSIIIMTTYGIAQFLLATSVIAAGEKQNSEFYKGSAS